MGFSLAFAPLALMLERGEQDRLFSNRDTKAQAGAGKKGTRDDGMADTDAISRGEFALAHKAVQDDIREIRTEVGDMSTRVAELEQQHVGIRRRYLVRNFRDGRFRRCNKISPTQRLHLNLWFSLNDGKRSGYCHYTSLY